MPRKPCTPLAPSIAAPSPRSSIDTKIDCVGVQVGRNALKKEHEMLWKSYWTEKSKGLDLFFFQACFSSVTGNMSRPL